MVKYCKDGKTIKKSGGFRPNSGVKSKFKNPISYKFTTEEELICSLKLKFKKKLNILINDYLASLDRKH